MCDGYRNSPRPDFGAEIDRSLKMNLVLNYEIITMILRINRDININ